MAKNEYGLVVILKYEHSFELNGEELYLDIILVGDKFFPRLCIYKSNKKYYIVYTPNEDKDNEFIVHSIKKRDIKDLMGGKFTVNEVIKSSIEVAWRVDLSNYECSKPITERLKEKDIDKIDLPDKNFRFKPVTPHHKEYYKKLS